MDFGTLDGEETIGVYFLAVALRAGMHVHYTPWMFLDGHHCARLSVVELCLSLYLGQSILRVITAVFDQERGECAHMACCVGDGLY